MTEEQKQLYKDWKKLVNMSPSELKKFLDSDEGKVAGLSKEEASKLNISRGRDSAKAILRMKEKSVDSWNETDWTWAQKQVNFIKRMSGNPGKLFDDKGRKTRKYLSLLVWGNDPKKLNESLIESVNRFL
jgi:hypoxanthine phosphoribosyltransferase